MTAFLASLTGRITERSTASPASGWIADILAFEHPFLKFAFNPYRPEQHYMRGPGPACAAKEARAAK